MSQEHRSGKPTPNHYEPESLRSVAPAGGLYARMMLRWCGHDVPQDVRYERLSARQSKIYDSHCEPQPHLVNRYRLPDGPDVLAAWCPKLKVVWWRELPLAATATKEPA